MLTVLAEDSDSPLNAQITYYLSSDESASSEHIHDVTFFKIPNRDFGEIVLVKKVPKNRERFVFSVIATDNGVPEARTSLVRVVVKVHEKQQNAPQWQSSENCRESIFVEENYQVNYFFMFKLVVITYKFLIFVYVILVKYGTH